mmetsp:Transcript_25423/g.58599  ORF Transcript_25423/g.58599 Transcript_25423/m.58599 type:complete len:257 (+) Transcript_25423:586-1356(+)
MWRSCCAEWAACCWDSVCCSTACRLSASLRTSLRPSWKLWWSEVCNFCAALCFSSRSSMRRTISRTRCDSRVAAARAEILSSLASTLFLARRVARRARARPCSTSLSMVSSLRVSSLPLRAAASTRSPILWKRRRSASSASSRRILALSLSIRLRSSPSTSALRRMTRFISCISFCSSSLAKRLRACFSMRSNSRRSLSAARSLLIMVLTLRLSSFSDLTSLRISLRAVWRCSMCSRWRVSSVMVSVWRRRASRSR